MLSKSEQALKEHFETVAKNWMVKFGISPTPLSEDEVLELAEGDLTKVWTARTEVFDSSTKINGVTIEYRSGFPIDPGYEPGFDDYYLGSIESAHGEEGVTYQELRFICAACEGFGSDSDDECDLCDGLGDFVYDFDPETGSYNN